MSKYIKLEDAEKAAGGASMFNGRVFVENVLARLADLPTIEVSEDCISRANLIQDLRKDAERVEMEEFANDTVWRTIGNAPSVISQVPSEDAISREQVLNLYKEWQPRLATNVYEFGLELEKLPSVIPTQNNAIQHVESVEKPKEGE